MAVKEWYGFLTPDDVFFNRVALTDINFFNFNCGSTVKVIRQNIAAWYYTLRVFALAALLVVLLYIGIRMAISTVASDQAKYKKMITDWLVSFALVFLLHYIIVLVLNVNNGLVEILKGIMDNMGVNSSGYEHVASKLVLNSFQLTATVSWASTICYAILVGVTAAFLFSYIKRMLIVGFLIMIAPIITITYSMDRAGDGKAQALNNWMREFFMNVLIQPFHCLIYLVFVSVVVNLISTTWSSVSAMILAIMCMTFIWTAEKIVKQIFGFQQSQTMADTVASLAAIKTVSEAAKKMASGGNGKLSRNLSRVVNNNTTLNRIGNRWNQSAPGRMMNNFRDTLDRNRNSTNALKRAGVTVADTMGKVIKESPALGIGIATAGITAGANQQGTALTTGSEAYNTVKEIQKLRAAKNEVPADVQSGENTLRDAIQQYAQQVGLENYKTNQAEFASLKAEVQRLLTTNVNTLESRVQMTLQAFAAAQGYDMNNANDVQQLAADMDRLATAPLNTLTVGTHEYNLARAMQEKEVAVRAQGLSGTYTSHGLTNPTAAIDEVLDRIQDDTFNDGTR